MVKSGTNTRCFWLCFCIKKRGALSSKSKKNFSFWVEAFLGGASQVGVFLGYFSHVCLALGAVPMGHFLDSKFS